MRFTILLSGLDSCTNSAPQNTDASKTNDTLHGSKVNDIIKQGCKGPIKTIHLAFHYTTAGSDNPNEIEKQPSYTKTTYFSREGFIQSENSESTVNGPEEFVYKYENNVLVARNQYQHKVKTRCTKYKWTGPLSYVESDYFIDYQDSTKSQLHVREKYTLGPDYRIISVEKLNKNNDSTTGKISAYEYDIAKGITRFMSSGDFSRTEK